MTRISLIVIFIIFALLNSFILGEEVNESAISQDYKKIPVVEWGRNELYQFIEKEFPSYLELFQLEFETKDVSGNEFILWQDDDLSILGIENEIDRSDILKRIQYFTNKSSATESQALTEKLLEEFWLPQDSNKPEHLRRFDLSKLEEKETRNFLGYFMMWCSSAPISFLYFYNSKRDLLRVILHLPSDYEFTWVDIIKYTIFSRFVIIKKIFELGYNEVFPFLAYISVIVHIAHIFTNVISIFMYRMFNPFSGLFPFIMGTISLFYLTPNFVLYSKMIVFMALIQAVTSILQAYVNGMMKNIQIKKKANATNTNKNSEASLNPLENTSTIPKTSNEETLEDKQKVD